MEKLESNYTTVDLPISINVTSMVLNVSSKCSGMAPEDCEMYLLYRTWMYYLQVYFIPVLVVVGLIGNVLNCMVYSSTHLQRMSSSTYLSACALSDIGYVLLLFLSWFDYMDISIMNRPVLCQGIVYLSYVFTFLSVWYVVSFTIERYISVVSPLRRPEMCTTSRARKVTCGLVALSFGLYSPSLVGTGVRPIGNHTTRCVALKEYDHLMTIVTCMDFIVCLIIPSICIAGMNSIISVKLYQFYSRQNNYHKDVAHYSTKGLSIQLNTNCLLDERKHSYILKTEQALKKQMKITKMLLIVSTVFIAFNTPSYVFRLYIYASKSLYGNKFKPTPEHYLVNQILYILFYVNCCLNFAMYSVFSHNFRKALYRLYSNAKYKTMRFFNSVYTPLVRWTRTPTTPTPDAA